MNQIEIIILAAGRGTRMRSNKPKVLHRIGGYSMLSRLLKTAAQLEPEKIHIVVGYEQQRVIDTISQECEELLELINWVEQSEQLGTGHAAMQALPKVDSDNYVLLLNGDTPLLSLNTMKKVVSQTADLTLLTVTMDDPTGMGRVVRDVAGDIVGIVEHKDASENQRKIQEINTNCMFVSAENLDSWLSQIQDDNAQNEFYLPDIITHAVAQEKIVGSVTSDNALETLGINTKVHLAKAERYFQASLSKQLMLNGVTVKDPARLDIRGDANIDTDTVVDINVILEGKVNIGKNCIIGPNCVIKDSNIADDSVILAHSVIESAAIGRDCRIGPFARIRPGANLADQVTIGNFVEVKKSSIDMGSKINHLSYVGDSTVGKNVNIGAGTITCNYDGANKHQTIIEDDVFIGSDSQLIAPVTINTGATIGAGSTISRDVAENALAISRAKQREVTDWSRPIKKEHEE